jgi:hypothetical protein
MPTALIPGRLDKRVELDLYPFDMKAFARAVALTRRKTLDEYRKLLRTSGISRSSAISVFVLSNAIVTGLEERLMLIEKAAEFHVLKGPYDYAMASLDRLMVQFSTLCMLPSLVWFDSFCGTIAPANRKTIQNCRDRVQAMESLIADPNSTRLLLERFASFRSGDFVLKDPVVILRVHESTHPAKELLGWFDEQRRLLARSGYGVSIPPIAARSPAAAAAAGMAIKDDSTDRPPLVDAAAIEDGTITEAGLSSVRSDLPDPHDFAELVKIDPSSLGRAAQ